MVELSCKKKLRERICLAWVRNSFKGHLRADTMHLRGSQQGDGDRFFTIEHCRRRRGQRQNFK